MVTTLTALAVVGLTLLAVFAAGGIYLNTTTVNENDSSSSGAPPNAGNWAVRVQAVELTFFYNGTDQGFFGSGSENLCRAQCPLDFPTDQVSLTLSLNVTNMDPSSIYHTIWFDSSSYAPIQPVTYTVQYSSAAEPNTFYSGPFYIDAGHTATLLVSISGGAESTQSGPITQTIDLLLMAS
jgi:hypothetical protein